jgi:hypothetical protein
MMKRLNPDWVHNWFDFKKLIISMNPHMMKSIRPVTLRLQARDSLQVLACIPEGVAMEKDQKPLRMFTFGEEVRFAFIST